MAASLADEAIALLLDLAEQGEINPWDVQVIDTIDRFLTKLAPRATTRDLSESGQAILYASMLVYLKAMALAETPEEEIEADFDPLCDADNDLAGISLEHLLRPRPVARITRTRPVTLKEIVEQLQAIELTLEQQEKARQKRAPKLSVVTERITSIAQLAHPENLAETVALLEPILAEIWQHSPAVSFDRLLDLHRDRHPGCASTANVLWALLIMASRSQVHLHQEEFYCDLTLLPLSHASVDLDPERPSEPEVKYSA